MIGREGLVGLEVWVGGGARVEQPGCCCGPPRFGMGRLLVLRARGGAREGALPLPLGRREEEVVKDGGGTAGRGGGGMRVDGGAGGGGPAVPFAVAVAVAVPGGGELESSCPVGSESVNAGTDWSSGRTAEALGVVCSSSQAESALGEPRSAVDSSFCSSDSPADGDDPGGVCWNPPKRDENHDGPRMQNRIVDARRTVTASSAISDALGGCCLLISYVIGACGSTWDQGPSVFFVDQRGEAGCLCLKTFEGKKMYLLVRKSVKKQV